MTAKSINYIMWNNTFDEIEMYIIIIFYFVVIFNSHMKTFKFDVHRHHHHLSWKCLFLPLEARVGRLTIWFPSIYPLNSRQQKHPKAWNLRVYETGRTFERWRKSGCSSRTNSFESCLKVIRLSSSELGYHVKIIHSWAMLLTTISLLL